MCFNLSFNFKSQKFHVENFPRSFTTKNLKKFISIVFADDFKRPLKSSFVLQLLASNRMLEDSDLISSYGDGQDPELTIISMHAFILLIYLIWNVVDSKDLKIPGSSSAHQNISDEINSYCTQIENYLKCLIRKWLNHILKIFNSCFSVSIFLI